MNVVYRFNVFRSVCENVLDVARRSLRRQTSCGRCVSPQQAPEISYQLMELLVARREHRVDAELQVCVVFSGVFFYAKKYMIILLFVYRSARRR